MKTFRTSNGTTTLLLQLLITNISYRHVIAENCEVGLDGTLLDDKTSDETIPASKNASTESENEQCGLYLAQSSIPNAGLGIYTGVHVPKGKRLGNPDVCVVATDVENDVIYEYSWHPYDIGAEFEAESVSGLCTGLGMAVNSHSGLNNVENEFPLIDSAGLHRYTHPGAGAITYYHNVETRVTTDVPAGSEVFISYGEQWFVEREAELGPIPLQMDYALTDHVSEAIELYLDDYGHQTSEESKEHVMKLVRTILTDLMPKVSSLLPEKMEDVSEVLAAGSARYSAPDSIRSLDWLQTNGYCIDNMKAGPSTIPDAGRGAFATRRIQEGALVSGSPLLRFERDKLVTNSVFSEQLVLNYCFGHPQSTLLLFPYAPLVGLINHNSKSPNVEIRWSTKEENNEISIWTKRSYNRLVKASKVPLMIEYVAKREIQPGEEIFLDYGAEWEAAWKEHVQNWTPPADSKDYVMATTFAKLMEDQPIRTGGEQEEDPYPENLITACYYEYEESDEQYADAEDEEDHLPIIMQVWEETDLLFTCHHYLRPCFILSRGEEEDGETFYTAEVFNLPDTTQDGVDLIPDTEHHVVTDIPRHAITFVELMYEGDQHLEGSFRHPIGFPDLIFPETWKNV